MRNERQRRARPRRPARRVVRERQPRLARIRPDVGYGTDCRVRTYSRTAAPRARRGMRSGDDAAALEQREHGSASAPSAIAPRASACRALAQRSRTRPRATSGTELCHSRGSSSRPATAGPSAAPTSPVSGGRLSRLPGPRVERFDDDRAEHLQEVWLARGRARGSPRRLRRRRPAGSPARADGRARARHRGPARLARSRSR